VRGDIAKALVFDGRFLHPSKGLTVFVRETGDDGAMRGVFVHDRRERESEVTYTAAEALLTEEDGAPLLVMFAGSAQRVEADTGALSVLRFERLTLDLGQFQQAARERTRKPSERYALELVAPTAEATRRLRSRRFRRRGP
jgi:lipopolysaccharide export system permease protein